MSSAADKDLVAVAMRSLDMLERVLEHLLVGSGSDSIAARHSHERALSTNPERPVQPGKSPSDVEFEKSRLEALKTLEALSPNGEELGGAMDVLSGSMTREPPHNI